MLLVMTIFCNLNYLVHLEKEPMPNEGNARSSKLGRNVRPDTGLMGRNRQKTESSAPDMPEAVRNLQLISCKRVD